MDSMRSLDRSLPPSTKSSPPPEDLLLAFKDAATSVTNLYRQAYTKATGARQTGYQEAIEDLLSFLDRRGLGLGDGEGWEVRKWATERSTGSSHTHDTEDDDARSEPPARPTEVDAQPNAHTPQLTTSDTQTVYEQRPVALDPQPVSLEIPPIAPVTQAIAPDTQSIVKVFDFQPRQLRQSIRQFHRQTPRRTVAAVAGSKRKPSQFGQYFDLDGLPDVKRPRAQ